MDEISYSESYYTNSVIVYTNCVIRHLFSKLHIRKQARVLLLVPNIFVTALVVHSDK